MEGGIAGGDDAAVDALLDAAEVVLPPIDIGERAARLVDNQVGGAEVPGVAARVEIIGDPADIGIEGLIQRLGAEAEISAR